LVEHTAENRGVAGSIPALATCVVALAVATVAAAGPGERPVVSPLVSRRIAAQWTGTYSYLPTWAPPRVLFSRWDIVTDAGAGNDRLVVHFTRPHVDLRWEVSDARELARVRARLKCPARGSGPVAYRKQRGVVTAWRCVGVGFPLMISVATTHRGDGPSRRELERMVASARPVRPGRLPGARYELTPVREVRRILSAYRAPLLLPTRLPPGFLFSRWAFDPHLYEESGRRSVVITFGREGRRIVWGVYTGVDTFGLDCPAGPSRWGHRRPTLVNGHRIYLVAGIHGASAWDCLPTHSVGNSRPIEVELWYAIQLDSPRMRRFAMRTVATARLVRSP
jgi:hypothetical protein